MASKKSDPVQVGIEATLELIAMDKDNSGSLSAKELSDDIVSDIQAAQKSPDLDVKIAANKVAAEIATRCESAKGEDIPINGYIASFAKEGDKTLSPEERKAVTKAFATVMPRGYEGTSENIHAEVAAEICQSDLGKLSTAFPPSSAEPGNRQR